MMTQDVQKQSQAARRNQLKRLLVVLSTAPVPEPKRPAYAKREKPAYLRYIEYA